MMVSVSKYIETEKSMQKLVFFKKKMGHSRPLFFIFRLFWKQLTVNNCSIKGPLVLEATALPTASQPLLSYNHCYLTCKPTFMQVAKMTKGIFETISLLLLCTKTLLKWRKYYQISFFLQNNLLNASVVQEHSAKRAPLFTKKNSFFDFYLY